MHPCLPSFWLVVESLVSVLLRRQSHFQGQEAILGPMLVPFGLMHTHTQTHTSPWKHICLATMIRRLSRI